MCKTVISKDCNLHLLEVGVFDVTFFCFWILQALSFTKIVWLNKYRQTIVAIIGPDKRKYK
jgi:hypothetical protein